MKKLKVALLGAGGRGRAYTNYIFAHPEQFEVVAVAEPLAAQRQYIQDKHKLPDVMCFTDWKPLLQQPKLADLMLICTMDELHYAPALAAIDKGYHLLLEKPIAQTARECREIAEAAQNKGVHVVVCHVLRFTAFFQRIKALLDADAIGEIVSLEHTEAVGNVHQSHSFVRGNWRNAKESAPMILAKSCHDMDLLQWLVGKKCTRIQSFGSLTYFRKENAPVGAPDRCLDGCPYKDACFYNAEKLYLSPEATDWFRRAATHNPNPTDALVLQALRDGPYGRCVFKCDNTVVDHQTVNMEFEGGITCVFSMNAFNEGGRSTRIMGTKGELIADMKTSHIEIYDFATRKTNVVLEDENALAQDITGGHGGGDEGIMEALYQFLNDAYTGNAICSIQTSYENHLMAFAAEEARLRGTVIDMENFR